MKKLFLSLFVVISLFAFNFSFLTVSHAAPLTDGSVLQMKNEKIPMPGNEGPSIFMSFVRLVSGLAIILGLILLVYYFINERIKKTGGIPGKGKIINIISTHYLAPKKAIMLIEVAGEYLLLGVGDEINFLTKIENLEGVVDSANSGQSEFTTYLKAASGNDRLTSVVSSISSTIERLREKR